MGNSPDMQYYGVDEMSTSERSEFFGWYEGHKDSVFDNKRVLKRTARTMCVAGSMLRAEA